MEKYECLVNTNVFCPMNISFLSNLSTSLHKRSLYRNSFSRGSKSYRKSTGNVVFLGIERAFKNVTTHAILQELSDQNVVNCINDRLVIIPKIRIVTVDHGNSSVSKTVNRDTPQGEIISPLLWLTVVNTILIDFYYKDFNSIAFVDDIVI